MLIYSAIEAFIWTIAFFCLKERYRPGHSLEKKRWLPDRVDGKFLSVALSVFIGIFGYLVRMILDSLHCMEPSTVAFLFHHHIHQAICPIHRSELVDGVSAAGTHEFLWYVLSSHAFKVCMLNSSPQPVLVV